MQITVEPEVIFNPVTGEELLVLESNAAVFKFAYTISPRGAIAGEHLHPHQQQTITVTAGELN
ncbi:hypothetical protein, partial [Escherichia coli]|uniref:hypothetical protein n=1 Tax=Escherichia coli TaxID=562 RepID=UPI000CBFCE06